MFSKKKLLKVLENLSIYADNNPKLFIITSLVSLGIILGLLIVETL